jgi:hypothetical protein
VKVAGVAIRSIVGVLLGIGSCFLVGGCHRSGATVSEATSLVAKAETIEGVNKDAQAIFNKFGTVGFDLWKPLSEADLTNYPSIHDLVSKLGDYSQVVIVPEGKMDSEEVTKFPAQIRIRFGSHSQTKFIFVLDSRKPFDRATITNRDQRWSQVSENIFIKQ